MVSINAFTGVAVAGMPQAPHAAAAIPQRKRRTATATLPSVNRGTT